MGPTVPTRVVRMRGTATGGRRRADPGAPFERQKPWPANTGVMSLGLGPGPELARTTTLEVAACKLASMPHLLRHARARESTTLRVPAEDLQHCSPAARPPASLSRASVANASIAHPPADGFSLRPIWGAGVSWPRRGSGAPARNVVMRILKFAVHMQGLRRIYARDQTCPGLGPTAERQIVHSGTASYPARLLARSSVRLIDQGPLDLARLTE